MTTMLAKGANDKLPTDKLFLRAKHKGAMTDLSAIMLNAAGKVRSGADFVFYGQPDCPEGCLHYVDRTVTADQYNHSLNVDLSKVPALIDRIEFTLTIDPNVSASFSAVKELAISICDGSGNELYSFSAEGTVETAFIVAEFYRRDGAWKVRHVAQGYSGGLAALATQFGIEIAESKPEPVAAAPVHIPASAPVPAPAPAKLQLTKSAQVTAELERTGSRLLSLQKAAVLSLTKHKIEGIVARVVMVLDASGSTERMWPAIMQGVTDRLATLALNLDDNGELDFWVYASGFRKMATVTLANLDGYIGSLQRGGDGSGATPMPKKGFMGGLFSGGVIPGLGYENNEPPVMQAILDQEIAAQNGTSATIPTLVLFVTDGGIYKDHAIQKLLITASYKPIFWQFVGLGGANYGVLERFDEMEGRYVDNAGFFSIDDYRSISDEDLYSRLVKEFPLWLKKVKALGMIA